MKDFVELIVVSLEGMALLAFYAVIFIGGLALGDALVTLLLK
jgi:hypothetical protein